MPSGPLIRPCLSTEIALKSFFLGPQSENAPWLLEQLEQTLRSWFLWRQGSFPQDGRAISGADQEQSEFKAHQDRMAALLAQLTQRFEAELPKFSPRYVGHMFSEISMPALLGHILTLLHNPNIVGRESATVAADIENEAIAELGRMVGFQRPCGHFTSGGTVANFEAVVRASARVYAWMAAGAVTRRRRGCELSLFQCAHMGWSSYRSLCQDIPESELRPFLAEAAGAWQAGRALQEAFAEPFMGPALIVPRSAHYSWKKAARVLGLGEDSLYRVESDLSGHYQVADLKAVIAGCQQRRQPVLAVVSVAGTTETGAIDPIDEIDRVLADLLASSGLHVWHHVDAAYGGFFCSMLPEDEDSSDGCALSEPSRRALQAVRKANSVTLDPHKLGYVPYSSGAFLTADEADYKCVQVLAPYLDFDVGRQPGACQAMDRGPYTLEGSRSAAGAVATWLTARAIGLDRPGYGLLLTRTIRQKQKLQAWLKEKLASARIFPGCDTNLLCFCVADEGEPVGMTNARTLRIIGRLAEQSRYYITKTAFPLTGSLSTVARAFVDGWSGQVDEEQLLVLRICLMNPFFDSSELDVDHVQHFVISLCEVAD